MSVYTMRERPIHSIHLVRPRITRAHQSKLYNRKRLFPLNKSNISSHLYGAVSSTKNGRAVTWRHVATLNWDNAAPFCETQNELRGVEFRFCPSCRPRSGNGRFEPEIRRFRPEKRLATSDECKRVIASGLHCEATCRSAQQAA